MHLLRSGEWGIPALHLHAGVCFSLVYLFITIALFKQQRVAPKCCTAPTRWPPLHMHDHLHPSSLDMALCFSDQILWDFSQYLVLLRWMVMVVVKDKWPSFSFNHTVLLQKLPSDIYSFNNALCAICSAFGIVVLNWFYFRTFNWTITVDFRLILYMVTKNCMKVSK